MWGTPREYIAGLVAATGAIALAIIAIMMARGEPADQGPLPISGYDAQLNDLDRDAVVMAYQKQVAHLFETWMKDPSGQPKRALTGMRQARRAFVDAMTELDKR